jgi:predicted nucleic acid-binding protein
VSRYAVDACFLIKCFITEEYTDEVTMFAEHDHELIVPDLFFPEVTNVLRKKVRRSELDADEARFALAQLLLLDLEVLSTSPLMEFALELSLRFNCSVYDATYFAVAAQASCPLITADKRFYNALRDSELGMHILWIEDVV